MRVRSVAVVSLLFTVAFFIEYTPLRPRVHIPYDLAGFHYPLLDYAFQAIRHGRFPQWDPTIYCGLSFAGNIQAALFYPPAWIMFAASLPYPRLPYMAVEIFVLAHVWLAFLLCYVWLREQKKLHWLASVLGAGVFAFSGYTLLNLQHLGLACGYAWIPLGFSAIDQTEEFRRWQPLWKLAVASAMCLLAGYPPTWAVFAVCMIAYAAARRRPLRSATWAVCALAGSLLLAAVQLLPAWETTGLRVPEDRYGPISGIRDPGFYISYFVPNYFDFGLRVAPETNPGGEYLYLGAAAFAGLALFLARRRFADAAPPLAVLVASVLFLTNPFGLPGRIVGLSSLLAQLFNAWYFLAGVSAAVAPLAAIGLDFGLTRKRRPLPAWLALASVGLALAWPIFLAIFWRGDKLPAGGRSGLEPLVVTVLCGALIAAFSGSFARMRAAAAMGLILLAAADYKKFGTSKRFNAHEGQLVDSRPDPGIQYLREHPEYRVIDAYGPPEDLRHFGLATPLGFDPTLPARYQALIERFTRFRTNREFDLPPDDTLALHLLGVGYFRVPGPNPLYPQLKSDPRYRLLRPLDDVFELLDARPSFGWEHSSADGSAEVSIWEPERREFRVRSGEGGVFRLTEQFYPGWTVTVDGMATPIQPCHEAFQCVALTPGEHLVGFRYRSRRLLPGAMISLASSLLAAAVWLYDAKRLRLPL